MVATFSSVRAACDSVVTITGRIRPAMLEFMDAVSINAVEDKLRMGLDRSAAAMMVAASDERGGAGAADAEYMAEVFAEYGATEVFSTSDPAEGEAFVVARRYAIPAVEAKGALLLEDVGVPLLSPGRSGRWDRGAGRAPRLGDLGDRPRRMTATPTR